MQTGRTYLNKAVIWLVAAGVVLTAGPAWTQDSACPIPRHVSRRVLVVCDLAGYPVKASPEQGLGLGQMKAMALQDRAPQVRYCALYALGESREPQISGLLIALLHDPDPRVRREAAHALGKLSQPSAVMPLIEVLCRPGECVAVRSAAAGSLGRLGDLRAVAVLTYHSQNQSAWVRGEAIKALARLESAGEMQRAGR